MGLSKKKASAFWFRCVKIDYIVDVNKKVSKQKQLLITAISTKISLTAICYKHFQATFIMARLPKSVQIKIVNLKELEEKVELANKLIKEIKKCHA